MKRKVKINDVPFDKKKLDEVFLFGKMKALRELIFPLGKFIPNCIWPSSTIQFSRAMDIMELLFPNEKLLFLPK